MPRGIVTENKPLSLIGQLRSHEFQLLRKAFQAHLEAWLENHDDTDASAEEIGAAFIAQNPELVRDFAISFVADLARQRSLWRG